MKQTTEKIITFLRCYQSLIAWFICASLVVMTFFHIYLPGELWIIVVMLGTFANFYLALKGNERYSLPRKFYVFTVVVAVFCFFIFMPINFFSGASALGSGSPRIIDGNYVLEYKGTIVRILTQQEYHSLKCIEQRFWTGHMLAFNSIAMYGHCERKKDKSKS